MGRARVLRLLLIATTVAGVSLPHLIVGEVASSPVTLILGLLLGLGCLRIALMARTRGGRVVGAIGMALAAVSPLIAYLIQETAEREPGLETAHAEPSLLVAIVTQAPLIALGFVAVRLLIAAVRTVVRAMRRGLPPPPRRPEAGVAPAWRESLSSPAVMVSSNGQRAPPFRRAISFPAPLT
jgi:hypothetical protein